MEDSKENSLVRGAGIIVGQSVRGQGGLAAADGTRLEARGKTLRVRPIVGTVRTEARGKDESTQGDGEREKKRVAGTGANMPKKYFPGK